MDDLKEVFDGMDPDELLRKAAYRGDFPAVESLLIRGANPNTPSLNSGDTALHRAASWRGNPRVIRILLDYGAETDPKNLFGNTPLHYAALCGHIAAVMLLLDRGADPFVGSNHYCPFLPTGCIIDVIQGWARDRNGKTKAKWRQAMDRIRRERADQFMEWWLAQGREEK